MSVSSERALIGRAALLAALFATGLGASGRFGAALALTLGAAVAIVSALWLSDLVGRLEASRRGAAARFDWKFGLKTFSRYAFAGILVFIAVRWLPEEAPWLAIGLSVIVALLAAQVIREARRPTPDAPRELQASGPAERKG